MLLVAVAVVVVVLERVSTVLAVLPQASVATPVVVSTVAVSVEAVVVLPLPTTTLRRVALQSSARRA
jgi:hypothetical protein